MARAPSALQWILLAALAAGASLLTAYLLRRRRLMPASPAKPEDLSRWESEGGNAPPRAEGEAEAAARPRGSRRTAH